MLYEMISNKKNTLCHILKKRIEKKIKQNECPIAIKFANLCLVENEVSELKDKAIEISINEGHDIPTFNVSQ